MERAQRLQCGKQTKNEWWDTEHGVCELKIESRKNHQNCPQNRRVGPFSQSPVLQEAKKKAPTRRFQEQLRTSRAQKYRVG